MTAPLEPVRCSNAPSHVPTKCAGPQPPIAAGEATFPANPCGAPGSLTRCLLCPASWDYWRHRDPHAVPCPIGESPSKVSNLSGTVSA